MPDGRPKTRAVVVSRESASLAGEPFDAMLQSVSFMPSVTQRICTSELKVLTIDRYLWNTRTLTKRQTRKLIGFRHDEPARWKPAIYQECEIAYLMVDAGVTAADMAEFWRAHVPYRGVVRGLEGGGAGRGRGRRYGRRSVAVLLYGLTGR